MLEEKVIILIINVLSLTGILILLFWLYGDYSIDAFRQQIFTIRDELFDEAKNGLLEFDHPAYGLLRGTMNGYIRFGHKLRLLELLVFMFLSRKEKKEVLSNDLAFEARWEKAIAGVNPATLTRLKEFRLRMNRKVLEYVLLRSPIFFAFIGFVAMLVIPSYLIQKSINLLEKTFKRQMMEIETAALTEGEY